jgi:uncharacterized protein YacL
VRLVSVVTKIIIADVILLICGIVIGLAIAYLVMKAMGYHR